MKYFGIPAQDVIELSVRLQIAQPIQILSIYFDPTSQDKRYEALVLLPETPPFVMHTMPWLKDQTPFGGRP